MDNRELSSQAKQLIQNALLNSSRQSMKMVKAQAHSMAKKAVNREQFQYGRKEGLRVLNFAVRFGYKFLFDLLLKELSVDPNIPDSYDGTTPLHHAASSGQIEMMELLVKNYVCDIEVKDYGNSTPLCLAILSGQNASVQKLLDYGAASVVQCFLGMPIHLALYKGNIDVVRLLHEKNPDALNCELYGFCTPLVAAAVYNSNDCFKYLAEVADVNAKPLMYKVICYSNSEESSLERVAILLRNGVSPNASYDTVTLFEDRPILCAARRGWKKMVETLLGSTHEIPGIEWSVEGVIQYVNSKEFKETHSASRRTRVILLKEKLLEELKSQNYLAADIVCKVLCVDMDQEEWDLYQSLCSFLILYGVSSIFPEVNAPSIQYLALTMGLSKESDYEILLLAAKACLALEPNSETYKAFLVSAKKEMEEFATKRLKRTPP